MRGSNFIDLSGQKFVRWLVIDRAEDYVFFDKTGKRKIQTQWNCLCDCGNKSICRGNQLKSKNTQSCGCLKKELHDMRISKSIVPQNHGKGRRIYRIYSNMKQRCYNSNTPTYEYYGGKGVYICDDWLNKKNGFINFYDWSMNNGYSEKLTIDRINVDKNYSPDNCRWVDMETQANNKTTSCFVKINNEIKTVKQWCDFYNLSYSAVRGRINQYGWSVKKALEIPKAINVEVLYG